TRLGNASLPVFARRRDGMPIVERELLAEHVQVIDPVESEQTRTLTQAAVTGHLPVLRQVHQADGFYLTQLWLDAAEGVVEHAYHAALLNGLAQPRHAGGRLVSRGRSGEEELAAPAIDGRA